MNRAVAIFLGVLFLASAALPVAAQQLPEGMTEGMIEEGRAIFIGAGLCMACHGMDGKGTVGPDLTDEEWFIGEGTYEQIVDRVLAGVGPGETNNALGAIMPPRGGSAITDEQVNQVAAYVWSLSRLED